MSSILDTERVYRNYTSNIQAPYLNARKGLYVNGANVGSDLSALQTQIDDLSEAHVIDIAALQSQITFLQEDVSTHETKITALQAQAATHETEITDLQTLTSAHDAEISTLQSDMTTAQDAITDIEATDITQGLDISTLQTKTQNQSATSSSTTFSNIVNYRYLRASGMPSVDLDIGYTDYRMADGDYTFQSNANYYWTTEILIPRGIWILEVVCTIGSTGTGTANKIFEVAVGPSPNAHANFKYNLRTTRYNYNGALLTNLTYQQYQFSHRQILYVDTGGVTFRAMTSAYYNGNAYIRQDSSFVQWTRLG